MDALTLTVISTVALAGLLPVYLYVARRYYTAWRGGDPIPYFAPTLALIMSICAAATLILFVALCTLAMRLTGNTVLPPGVGLLLIVVAVFVPAPSMVWLLALLVGRKRP